jgi:excinuclease ABC subunit A
LSLVTPQSPTPESQKSGSQLPSVDCICVRGARVHNLQNVDVDIPREQFVVITGPSGSGKSSLAFDTLFAEGQRQFIESLSVYARQFLHQMERPDVDLIEGLQPTICIDQRAGSQNPRSTVATVTEIYDHLRLLFARVGEAFCYQCGEPIRQQTPEQILEDLLALPEGKKVMILAPFVRGRKGEHAETFETIRKAGFVRARIDGTVYELENLPKLTRQKNHTIEAVVDRIIIRESIRTRLAESINLAIKHGEGLIVVTWMDETPGKSAGTWHDKLFSTQYSCPTCKLSYEELQPRTFSFNSPYGACPQCQGLGSAVTFDRELVAPDLALSLSDDAILPWKTATAAAQTQHRKQLTPFLSAHGVRWSTPLEKMSAAVRKQLFDGDGGDFPGVLSLLEQEYAAAKSDAARERLETFRGEVTCSACQGTRLRPEARSVKIGGRRIYETTALAVDDAWAFFNALSFPADEEPIAEPLVEEIVGRLEFLRKVGLSYLTLDRPADTLSGGELQRIRLATGIGSGLVGVCYVLDEPSIGLHPRDNERLIEALRDLQGQGNTLLVVEHDEAIMRQADHLIDMGPGAGKHGGRIIAQGTPQEVCASPDSVTGKYLSGELSIPVPAHRRPISQKRSIFLEGATTNNLKLADVSVQFPLGVLVCVTGVSGSGKSSLLNETLARAIVRRLTGLGPKPGPHASLRGVSQIDKLVEIDQTPIGRTPRSNPATYTGVFDEIRKVFATTRESRVRGYKAGRFSFNTTGGRCEECQGQGQRKIEMNFLPDLYVPCPVCEGKRFNRQTLEVRYRGLSIADTLDLRVDDAVEFFENFPQIRRLLSTLQEVGLGYLTLGQSSITLSGGEAQRIKLATELSRPDTGKTLYLLDEPTTGLHFDDVRRLLKVLDHLVELGNTVIVIEHHLDVIKAADWLIDLGPEGGAGGGHLVASGTPEEIAAIEDNHTGRFLRPLLEKR